MTHPPLPHYCGAVGVIARSKTHDFLAGEKFIANSDDQYLPCKTP